MDRTAIDVLVSPGCPACKVGRGVTFSVLLEGRLKTVRYTCQQCAYAWDAIAYQPAWFPACADYPGATPHDHQFPTCPVCRVGDGLPRALTLGPDRRTIGYTCNRCQHVWEAPDPVLLCYKTPEIDAALRQQ